MYSPTPLEIASALRSAAEFCRDPNSPKSHGALARGTHLNPVTGLLTCDPTSPRAASWCAIGYAQRVLGMEGNETLVKTLREMGLNPEEVIAAFDAENHRAAADEVEVIAAELEASIPTDAIPTRVPAETQEHLHV